MMIAVDKTRLSEVKRGNSACENLYKSRTFSLLPSIFRGNH